MTDDASVDEAIDLSGEVDALLPDSGNPKLAIKESGVRKNAQLEAEQESC